MTTFKVKPSPHPHTRQEREAALADLKFGREFTDHMARATWDVDSGWHDFRVEAYAPLMLDPATAVLHYARRPPMPATDAATEWHDSPNR